MLKISSVQLHYTFSYIAATYTMIVLEFRQTIIILGFEFAYITEKIFQNIDLVNALKWTGLQVSKHGPWLFKELMAQIQPV